MEQEVPVTIHSGKPKELTEEPRYETPKQQSEISETLDQALSRFKQSEFGTLMLKGAEKATEYIKKNPGQAMLFSVGAGAFFGLLLKKK
ncbi:MAG: hypothetical protein JZU70_01675 [Chlorobium sp.]|jgi:ElaB/YqjD/DUF883 family membrane-anchored ribosome-binding protein|nr:hypothetical protein [Chlorobium sp.]